MKSVDVALKMKSVDATVGTSVVKTIKQSQRLLALFKQLQQAEQGKTSTALKLPVKTR